MGGTRKKRGPRQQVVHFNVMAVAGNVRHDLTIVSDTDANAVCAIEESVIETRPPSEPCPVSRESQTGDEPERWNLMRDTS